MANDLSQALTGISGILATPFDEAGDIAPDRQAPIVERAIAAGVHILTANGNTGEFYGLTLDEAEAMVQAAAGTSPAACRWSPASDAASATPAGWPGPRRMRALRP